MVSRFAIQDDDDGLGPELVPQAPPRTAGWWVSLCMTLAMSAGAGWFGWHVWWERDFAKRVEGLGGEVEVSTMGPAWLVERAPRVYLDTVTQVTRVRLQRAAVDDELVRAIAGRPAITSLNLDDTGLTDGQLAELAAGLRRLRSLSLRNAKLTDAAVGHLAGLGELRVVDLTGVALSEAAAARLRAALANAVVYTTPERENTQDDGPLVVPGEPGEPGESSGGR